MSEVSIQPLPVAFHKVPKRLWMSCPPIFPGADVVTPADISLARELFQCLDDLSKDWYRRDHPRIFNGL